jgi:hypothetical protein
MKKMILTNIKWIESAEISADFFSLYRQIKQIQWQIDRIPANEKAIIQF